MNNYENILTELDAIFNIDLKAFRTNYEAVHDCKLTQEQFYKVFNEERKVKMENSIAKMRQMRFQAERVINPMVADAMIEDPNVGSRPNFNIDFETKQTYLCKPDPEKTDKKKG